MYFNAGVGQQSTVHNRRHITTVSQGTKVPAPFSEHSSQICASLTDHTDCSRINARSGNKTSASVQASDHKSNSATTNNSTYLTLGRCISTLVLVNKVQSTIGVTSLQSAKVQLIPYPRGFQQNKRREWESNLCPSASIGSQVKLATPWLLHLIGMV